MVEIKELEKLCKDQYQKFLEDKDCATISYSRDILGGVVYNKDEISFDKIEQRGDFLVASKTKETVIKEDYYEENEADKASYALYFIAPYKDGKIGNNTLLISASSQNTRAGFGSEGDAVYNCETSLCARQSEDVLARITSRGYANVTDKDMLANFIADAYIHPDSYSAMRTHNEENYSVLNEEYDRLCDSYGDWSTNDKPSMRRNRKKYNELHEADLSTNLDRVSKLFDSFIGSDGDIEKMKEKAYNEANLKRKEERKAKIEAKIDKLKKPFKNMAAAKELKRKQKERAKKEKEITKSLPRAAGRDE